MAYQDIDIPASAIRAWHITAEYAAEKIEKLRLIVCSSRSKLTPKAESSIVESIIMRIPVYPFIAAESADGSLDIVDGGERLSTIKRYIYGDFKLLSDFKILNGKRISDLPNMLQNRIYDCNLIVYIIEHGTPADAKADTITRIMAQK